MLKFNIRSVVNKFLGPKLVEICSDSQFCTEMDHIETVNLVFTLVFGFPALVGYI